jgi:hypothetical protein
MGRDLGTYHIRVILKDGRGFIQRWNTGIRYTRGTVEEKPLGAIRIMPPYNSEEELFRCVKHMFTDGGFSCDCNKTLFLCRAYGLEEPEEDEPQCGDTMQIESLTAIKPDGSEVDLLFDEVSP